MRLVGADRLHGAPRPGEGAHQESHRPIVVRHLLHQRLQTGHSRARARIDLTLEHTEQDSLVLVGHQNRQRIETRVRSYIGRRLISPELHGAVEIGSGHALAIPQQIDVAARAESVAGRGRLDHTRIEKPPQRGHVGLQRGACAGRGVADPDVLNQPVGAGSTGPIEREEGEDHSLLPRREFDSRASHPGAHWPEHVDLHDGAHRGVWVTHDQER